jgi:HD-GYP domain-containing protein (c-di-GMP phosphodiesterase class II)
MQWIEKFQYFLNVILPKSIIETFTQINSLMSETVGWIILLILLIVIYFVYNLYEKVSKLKEHEYEIDEILFKNSKSSSINDVHINFIEFGLWLNGEYVSLYQLQGQTYVLLTSNIALDDENSPAAASLHVSKREIKLNYTSGNFEVSSYISVNERYLFCVYARKRIDFSRYYGVIESLFSRYNALQHNDENVTELNLAKTSKLLFETINGTRFGDDGYMRYLLSMVKKVINAKYIVLFTENELRIKLGDCTTCKKKVFYIRNTNYRVEIGTLEDMDIQSQTTVGSFLDLTGVFISTLSEESKIAKNYIIFLEQANAMLEREDDHKILHSEKVNIVTMEIGKVLFLSTAELDALEHASKLHDIGSIGNVDDLLIEQYDESDSYKLHPLIGSILLEPVSNIFPITSIVKYHHERIDGKGYPFGIKGDEIPHLAQILGLAEYYIGLVSNHTIKHAYTHEHALLLVEKSAGKMFEKVIVEAFLSVHTKIEKKLIQLENKHIK